MRARLRSAGATSAWWASVPAVSFLLAVTIGGVEGDAARVLTNVGQLSAVSWAALVMLRATRSASGATRRAWWCISAAAVCWGGAQALYGFFDVILGSTPPELIETAYLLSVPLCLAGLLCFVETPATWAARTVAMLEAALLATATLSVAWVVLLRRLFEEGDGDSTARAVALAFPVAEVLIATVLLFVAGRSRPGTRRQLGVVALGVGLFVVADSFLLVGTMAGTYETGTWTDVWWMVAWLVLGSAGRLRAPEAGDRFLGEGRVARLSDLLVHLPVGLAFGFVLVDLRTRPGAPASLVFLAVLAAGVVTHGMASARERVRLTEFLEDEVAHRTADLVREKRFFRSLLSQSSEVVLVLDTDRVVTHLTASLSGTLGYDADRFVGRPAHLLVITDDVDIFREALGEAERRPGSPELAVVRTIHADGSPRTMELTIVSLLHDPELRAIVVNARDVTERVALADELAHLAFHDELTGLPNRTRFREAVDAVLGTGTEAAVLFVDLDGFKAVNDALGHTAGDRLLATIAGRLHDAVPSPGMVARLGGDEFAVLAIGGVDEATTLARRLLTTLEAPLELDGRDLPVTASIGIAGAGPGSTAADLLRDADVAMYRAKGRGRGRIERFTPEMHDDAVARLELGADLSRAVGRGELHVLYQPIVELASGHIVGAEALLRWEHPRLGTISPVTFIPLAEATGEIVEIGRWVLAESARQARSWHRTLGDDAPRVSVNVSGRQLLEDGFVQDAIETVHAVGAQPEWLVLELTEGVLVDVLGGSVEKLHALRAAGFRLAIDDFGTGYSALSYLHRLPVDELKIDRSFVAALEHGGEDAGLVRMIIELAVALSLTTVAEGIETEEQRSILEALGCEFGQGYLFARPGEAQLVLDAASLARS